jgi:HAD superfamily hydrolase (TIGR01450 family)
MAIQLKDKRLFLFDLDGVLLKGKEKPIKLGGTIVFEKIRSRGKKLLVVTNNSTDTVEAVHRRLKRAGIPVALEEVLTSTRLTAEYIAETYGNASFFLVGERGFEAELRRAGLTRSRGSKADVVVVGLDRRLTYAKLDKAVRLARGGAHIVACHPSRMYMYKRGPAIGVGPILKAIEYGAEKRGVSIGKPSPLMFELALKLAGCSAEETVMVGDQEDTDVEGASRVGIDAILVLSGLYDGKTKTKAVGVVENVDDLADYI